MKINDRGGFVETIRRPVAVVVFCVLFITICFASPAWAQKPSAPGDDPGLQAPSAHDEPTETSAPDQDASETETAQQVAPLPVTLSRSEQIDHFEDRLNRFAVNEDDARDLFNHFRDETRLRLWQFTMALNSARSTVEVAKIDPAELEARHPGFPKQAYRLPEGVVTVRDLYDDTLDVFWARNRMLELIAPELREEAVGSALYGMQELRSERDLIIVEVRYQVLRLPQAALQIKRMALQAPVLLIWIIVQFWLAIFLFRWWRRWLPATMQRMRTSLLAIRPRTDEVLTRLRGLWYINQVRTPLEWLLLWTFLFSLMSFDGLDFVRDVGLIVVRWIMLTWFAVALLNAYVARGAGGLTGESAQLRLKSMRLVAGWLLLLGLGLDLSDHLVGDAALTSWIWHVFQLLAFPLICVLLSIWHMELYARFEREGDVDIPRDDYAQQRGLRRWVGSAKVLGLLIAGRLRSVLIRRIEQLGTMRMTAGLQTPSDSEKAVPESTRLTTETRALLIKGHDAFTKYARLERQELLTRINDGQGGVIGIVGERGIGKNGFLRQVAEAHEHKTLFLECRSGSAADLVAQFCQQLGLEGVDATDAELNAALTEQDVRLIAVFDMHLLLRPVIGGFGELAGLSELFGRVHVPLVWGMSVDRYAYQFIARARGACPSIAMPTSLLPGREPTTSSATC